MCKALLLSAVAKKFGLAGFQMNLVIPSQPVKPFTQNSLECLNRINSYNPQALRCLVVFVKNSPQIQPSIFRDSGQNVLLLAHKLNVGKTAGMTFQQIPGSSFLV
jgi:hypothetical protein